MRAGGRVIPWEFERDGHDLEVKVEGPLTVNEPELAVDAALDGLGLAYALRPGSAPRRRVALSSQSRRLGADGEGD
jgi:hypothetical protein